MELSLLRALAQPADQEHDMSLQLDWQLLAGLGGICYERGQQTQDGAVHVVDLWRFDGEYLAISLLSSRQSVAALLRRRTGHDRMSC
jgi:hypothetical protein